MKLREYSANNVHLEDDSEGGEEYSQSNPYFSMPAIFNIIKRKAWLIAGLGLLGTLAGVSACILLKQTYKGNFYLLVEPVSSAGKYTSPEAIVRNESNDSLYSLDYPTNLAFLRSPGMFYRIAQDVSKKDRTQSFPKIWADLRDNLVVKRIGDTARDATKIFEVSYYGKDPQVVQKVLEVASQTFVKYSEEDRRTSIKSGLSFIDKQIPGLEKILANLQAQQQKIREENNLINPLIQGEEISKSLTGIDAQIIQAQIELDQEKILYNQLSQQLKLTPEEGLAASNITEDPIYSSQVKQLKDIQTQLAISSADLTDDNPQIQSLKEKERNLKALLHTREREILRSNGSFDHNNSAVLSFQGGARIALINQLIGAYNKIKISQNTLNNLKSNRLTLESRVKKMPSIITKYNKIETAIGINKEVLNKLLVQKETLQVEGSQDLPWQVISKPQIPIGPDGQPVGEKKAWKKIVPLGLLGGLTLGALLAIAIEKRQNVFQTSEDLKLILKLPILGELPKLEGNYSDEIEQITWRKSFEYLYANLNSLYREIGLRSFVVCPIDEQKNQDSIVMQLAKTAAATGKKILLVDTNFGVSQLHNQLNLNNRQGLSNLLTEDLNLTEVIQRSSEYNNLDFISSGNTSLPVESLLMSPKMKQLVREFKIRYDLVIYNPSSFYEATEISSLTTNTDGLILVVQIGMTRESSVKEAVEQLRNLRLPILGIIAVEVPENQIKIPIVSSYSSPVHQMNQNGSGNFESNHSSSDKYK